jgi:hypothetical protein
MPDRFTLCAALRCWPAARKPARGSCQPEPERERAAGQVPLLHAAAETEPLESSHTLSHSDHLT